MTDPDHLTIEKPVIALAGPTAVGKTELSLSLAREFNCEIISVDSMQVYRYMDIGTAKASPEERRLVPHHLIDIVDPDEDYHAARFVEDCLTTLRAIHERGAIPLLTGGTGLYFRSLRQGLFRSRPVDPGIRHEVQRRLTEEGVTALHQSLAQVDPVAATRIHPHDKARVTRALEVYLAGGKPLSELFDRHRSEGGRLAFSHYLSLGVFCERQTLYRRIEERTSQLLEVGLEGEVRGLLERGFAAELKSMQSIGYRHMVNHIRGDWSLGQCRHYLARDTRRYAKRQFTWFNGDDSIHWFDRDKVGDIHREVAAALRRANFC